MNTRTKAQNQRPGFSTADHWLRGGQVVGHTWDMTVEVNAMSHGQILLADRAYDSDGLRNRLAEKGTWANIKLMPNRVNIPAFSDVLYRCRNLVERFFNKLKHFRAIATRFEKHDDNYMALVKLASAKIWMRFMRR